MTATGTTSVMTTNIGGGNYVVDVNGIIPGLITQYDNGAQVLRVVPRFESFDFENQTLTGICLEFIWVSQLNTWISYNSGKYDDNRFTADNTVLIDTSQSGQLIEDPAPTKTENEKGEKQVEEITIDQLADLIVSFDNRLKKLEATITNLRGALQ